MRLKQLKQTFDSSISMFRSYRSSCLLSEQKLYFYGTDFIRNKVGLYLIKVIDDC